MKETRAAADIGLDSKQVPGCWVGRGCGVR